MKKTIIFIIFIFFSLLLISCTPSKEENKEQPQESEGIRDEKIQTNEDLPSEPKTMLPEIEEKKHNQFKSSELENIDSNFNFQAEIPNNWQAEYIPDSQAINFYNPEASDKSNLDKSQIFVKYFNASSFLTLSTVTIYSREELTINNRPAMRYDIEKKSGVVNFPAQPLWRNERHFVTDIRSTDDSPTTFYVFGRRPDLDEGIFNNFLQSIKFE